MDQRIGFVPTMGHLHEGHLSLVRLARARCDFLVVSIFVNPLQFGPGEDYLDYPRDLARDLRLLEPEGVDLVFHPEPREFYPEDFSTRVEVTGLTEGLCGRSRPGHFTGVATVLTKLFNLVSPDLAVFGQKDAQQAYMVRRLVRDLNFDIEILIAPTVREEDGLALSSRNSYLTPEERREAGALFKALQVAQGLIEEGERNPNRVKDAMRQILEPLPHTRIDYISIVETKNLSEVEELKGEVMIALALWVGRARLIDNLILTVP